MKRLLLIGLVTVAPTSGAASESLLDGALRGGRILDLATFENPNQYSRGILYVLVNGTPVVEKGATTASLPGRGNGTFRILDHRFGI